MDTTMQHFQYLRKSKDQLSRIQHFHAASASSDKTPLFTGDEVVYASFLEITADSFVTYASFLVKVCTSSSGMVLYTGG